jgi:hypothetical protein
MHPAKALSFYDRAFSVIIVVPAGMKGMGNVKNRGLFRVRYVTANQLSLCHRRREKWVSEGN